MLESRLLFLEPDPMLNPRDNPSEIMQNWWKLQQGEADQETVERQRAHEEKLERWKPLVEEVTTHVIERGGIGAALRGIQSLLAEQLGTIAQQKDPKGEFLFVLGEIVRAAKDAHSISYLWEHAQKGRGEDDAIEDWMKSSAEFSQWTTNLFAQVV